MGNNLEPIAAVCWVALVFMLAWYETTNNERFANDHDAIVEGACVVHLLDDTTGIVAENNNDPFSDRFGIRFDAMDDWSYYSRREFRRCTAEESFE
jgi:hypothetical protein